MTAVDLPPGHRRRRPTVEDVPAIYQLIAAHNTALIGTPDLTEDDLYDEFAEAGFDPAADAWLVTDGDGRTAGYAWAARKGTSAEVNLDFYVDPGADPGLAGLLLTLTEARAAEIGRELGHTEIRIGKGCYREARDEAALLTGRGYTVATTFSRMSRPLEGAPDDPPIPAGVVLRVCGADHDLLRAAHGVKELAFVDHFGNVPQTFGEWYSRHADRSATDWSQMWLAELDGQPVGMLLGTNAFIPTDNAGYVQTLAVHPEARGRGLAKLLLRTAFAEMRRRGRTKVILDVDTNNTSGALALYESLGMRPDLRVDVWRCARQTEPAGSDQPAGSPGLSP